MVYVLGLGLTMPPTLLFQADEVSGKPASFLRPLLGKGMQKSSVFCDNTLLSQHIRTALQSLSY